MGFKLELPTEIMKDIQKIYDNTDEILGEMTRAGAAVVEANMRSNAPQVLKDYVKVTRTYRTPSDGGINTKVIVKGYIPFSDPNRKGFTRNGGGGDSYTTDKGNIMAIPVDKVKEIIALNHKGQKPKKLEDYAVTMEAHTNTNEGYGEADLKKMSD